MRNLGSGLSTLSLLVKSLIKALYRKQIQDMCCVVNGTGTTSQQATREAPLLIHRVTENNVGHRICLCTPLQNVGNSSALGSGKPKADFTSE